MREVGQEIAAWWKRRRRFAEEWRFHLETAAAELESLGLDPAEARRMARERLGRMRAHRAEALRELRADGRGLLRALPWKRMRRSPWAPPILIAMALLVCLVLTPNIEQVVGNLRRIATFAPPAQGQRLIPLPTEGPVPVGYAALVLWGFLLLGVARLVFSAASLRLRCYALILLIEASLASAMAWTTGLQLLFRLRWGWDLAQGMVLGLFLLSYAWGCWLALRAWWRDVELRCPVCLERGALPDLRGKACDVLVDPLECESVCTRGHGLIFEGRWRRGHAIS